MIRLILVAGFVAVASATDARCSGGIPSAEVESILAVHNTLRKKIALGVYKAQSTTMPRATAALPNLKWNCDIEANAQTWCNNKNFAHSPQTQRPGMGENLYWAYTSAGFSNTMGLGKAASDAWEKEFQDFGWASINLTLATFNTGIGHATQMAWQATTEIGCGEVIYDVGNKQALVCCQYKPQGNFLNWNIYNPV